ncbi:transposase [Streptomyces canus]
MRQAADGARLSRALSGLPQPQAADNRLVLAVDGTNWLRPDAVRSPDRQFCRVHGRNGRSSDQFMAAWRRAAPPGANCWTRSAWAPTTTSPRSPPSRSAAWSPT